MSGRSSKTSLSMFFLGGCCGSGQDVQNFITFSDGIFPYVLEMLCFKFQVRKVINDPPIYHLQSWILGGQVVPDTLSGCNICPVDAMFQISAF